MSFIITVSLFSFSYALSQPSSLSFASVADMSEPLPKLVDSKLMVEKVVGILNMPTTMAFLNSDDFLVLQKNGTVLRITNGTVFGPLLNVNVASGFYQGLLGVAVSNDNLSSNSSTSPSPYVFLYYTEIIDEGNNDNEDKKENNDQSIANRVYRYELADNKLINPVLLLDLPAYPGPEDNGGYITIGPDGNLYIVIGEVTSGINETAVQTLAQNYVNGSAVDGRAGILRITQDGNPVVNENGEVGLLGESYPLNLYYSYGIHNGFGMDFDPITGALWNTETGHFINDEINLVRPGFNSGYGTIQGLSIYFPSSPSALIYFNGSGRYSDPEFVWEQKAVPTGLKFLTSDKLGKEYLNDIFVGGFNDGRLYHFDLNDERTGLLLPSQLSSKVLKTLNSTGNEDIVFGTGFGGISNLAISPDGYLYIVSFVNGSIYKIMPKV